MTAALIDGKAIAKQIQGEIAARVKELVRRTGTRPGLAAVLVGDDPASAVYVRNKQRACDRVGIYSVLHQLPSETSEKDLRALLDQLNADAQIHGILVQSPLPDHLPERDVLDCVDPRKDVDGLHPENLGRLMQGRPRYVSCTPAGIQQLLLRSGVAVEGAHVVVVGRSELVGKPLAALLMQKSAGANATVTVCHSRSKDIAALTRLADVVVVAIGKPRFLTADMVRPGAVVIDVGINREGDRLVGDVDFEAVREIAGLITPVPGGVGPMTVTMLLQNTLQAAAQSLEDGGRP
jgi:methylenetetrahydrofolate dehydrogenase (NADP+)/methenyltetrahydrofolate cyclohydrolase